jgi:aldose sugar dehydrogenase
MKAGWIPSAVQGRLELMVVIAFASVVLLAALIAWAATRDRISEQPQPPGVTESGERLPGEPQLSTEVVVDGRAHVWDVAFLPSGDMLFTERRGVLSAVVDGEVQDVASIVDVRAQGEGGLLGLAVDYEFSQNRYIYTCFNSEEGDVRVVRWSLDEDLGGLDERVDIVTGIPANPSGRHSGCRIGFGLDGMLWVTTGDAAIGSVPQDPNSLGGEFDPRIFSYGHRNPQGLAFLTTPHNGIPGVSVEHGPDTDDQVNLLVSGNFGWDPVPGYSESVPMTNTEKFPDAVEAVWESGRPPQAPSGATFVYGDNWRDWHGALAIAMLRDQRLRFLFFSENWEVEAEEERFVEEFGRLRAAVWSPDQNLYITTDNGTDDKIIRVTPN